MSHPHPYYPLSAKIPTFQPNTTPLPLLLSCFLACLAPVILLVCYIARRVVSRRLTVSDQFAACWFACSGLLHTLFEGYYIYHRHEIAGMNTIPAQLWKEYCLSDSRYLTLDVFTVCVETITVFLWGPLCLITAFAILATHPSRHFYQVVVCTAHLYGVLLYYFTNWLESQQHHLSYSRPEFLYFWIYYVAFNLPWLIVPLGLLWGSCQETRRAFRTLHEVEDRRKVK